jgi:VCBS repeat-containing protein
MVNQSSAQTIPLSGDIVFTEFQTDNDVAEFITLKRLDLRNVGFTDNGILKSGAFRTGEGIFTIPNTSNFADIPGGTFVRLVSTPGTNDTDASDGIIVLHGTNFDLSTSGDQIIAYTSTFANPSFIAGINGGDASGWNKGATSDNNSKAPGTLSDIDVSSAKNNDNARLLPTVAVSGNASTIRNSIKASGNWEKNNNPFASFVLKNILFNESNYLSGPLAFSSIASSSFTVDLSGLSFSNTNADTRYVVVINGGSPSNPVDRFTCYSGITDNISTSVSVVTTVGTPPCINPTPGNGKVVYFNYGLPSSVIINGLSPNTSYQLKVFALNGNGYSANVSSTPATGSQATADCPSAIIAYPGSSFCNSIPTPQVPTITGTSGGNFNYTGTGTLSINTSTGAIVPSASTPGTYTVHYQISASGSCSSVDATASIIVNGAPIIANPISDINTSEDASPHSIDISNVFSDADGNSLTIEVSSNNISLVGASYDPATGVTLGYGNNASGSVSITVTARDACGGGIADQFVVNVAAVNDAPVARDSTSSGNEDATSITGSVKASDIEGDNLTYSLVSNVDASKGTLTFNPNGTYSFVPALNFNGTVSFTYRAYDGQTYSNVATVTITVNPVNDAPVVNFYNNNWTIYEDFGVLSIPLSNTFVDIDGDVLTVSVESFLGPIGFPNYNSVTKQLDIYFVGNASGFTSINMRASDGSAYVNYPIYIMVLSVNDAPSGTSKTITTNEDVAFTFTQSDFGFSDIVDYPSNNLKAVKLTTLPSSGSLLLNGSPITTAGTVVAVADINASKLTFQPAENGNGVPYSSFNFQVQDDGGVDPFYIGGEDLDPFPKTITINVTPINDKPIVSSMVFITRKNVPIQGQLVGWDTEGNSLKYGLVFISANGAVAVSEDGYFSYYPIGNFEGMDFFAVKANDGELDSELAYISIYIEPGSETANRTLRTTTKAPESKVMENNFELSAYPNPTTSQFNVKLESPDNKTSMTLRVIDLSGKIIEVKRGLMAGQTFQLGVNYRPGMYFIELTQGDQRRIVKVVKQAD